MLEMLEKVLPHAHDFGLFNEIKQLIKKATEL
jgi:hypothetical protein